MNLFPPPRSAKSHELLEVTETFADRRVRRYSLFSYDLAMRTEIALPDGRLVTVHKNPPEVDPGYSAQSKYESIVVSKNDTPIGTVWLTPASNRNDSHSYIATLNGRRLRRVYGGDRNAQIDLSLADNLLPNTIADQYGRNFILAQGNTQGLAVVIGLMVEGYSDADIDQKWFEQPGLPNDDPRL